ncbi:jg6902 [Pararge aegeria aegeria]|uniref:Jg6902 protein n=1 Tax=Pararge aegeria aegeria TaxID=348720 RepID=A0A8S4QK05_9NEOP|nr:jg6902 [Pararge aegeria aegeria]
MTLYCFQRSAAGLKTLPTLGLPIIARRMGWRSMDVAGDASISIEDAAAVFRAREEWCQLYSNLPKPHGTIPWDLGASEPLVPVIVTAVPPDYHVERKKEERNIYFLHCTTHYNIHNTTYVM